MSDNKKYYYLKLKENFFESEEIKLLESGENGYLYSNILLKMYLKSLKSEGRLMFRENIPYNSKMLSVITGHNADVIDKAINIFVQFGLVQVLDNGAIYLIDIQNYIGESSTEADRIRQYRNKIDSENSDLSKSCTNVRQMYDKCTPEIEKDLEKEKTFMSGNPDDRVIFNNIEIKKPSFAKESYKQDFDEIDYAPELRNITPPNKQGEVLSRMAMIVLKHLNWLTGKRFRPVDSCLNPIRALLKEGITLGDCFVIHSRKQQEWQGKENKDGTPMETYLRPTTLYRKSLFFNYLGDAKR